PLGVGIEQAKALEFVAEEVQPEPRFEPRRMNVEDRSSYSEFAAVDHRIGAAVALPLKQRDQALVADRGPRPEFAHAFADPERGQDPLGQGVDRSDQELVVRLARLQLVKRRKPTAAYR